MKDPHSSQDPDLSGDPLEPNPTTKKSRRSKIDDCWDQVEKEARLLQCLLNRLPLQDRMPVAHFWIVDIVMNSCCCYESAKALLKECKWEVKQLFLDTMEDED